MLTCTSVMPARWNCTPAPGWTREEVQVLKLCLMKYGVGHWQHIHSTGLLPGKLIGQLNGQTQRLLGQQSLAGDACCGDPAPIFLLGKSTHANTLGLTLFVLVTLPSSIHWPAAGCGSRAGRQPAAHRCAAQGWPHHLRGPASQSRAQGTMAQGGTREVSWKRPSKHKDDFAGVTLWSG